METNQEITPVKQLNLWKSFCMDRYYYSNGLLLTLCVDSIFSLFVICDLEQRVKDLTGWSSLICCYFFGVFHFRYCVTAVGAFPVVLLS